MGKGTKKSAGVIKAPAVRVDQRHLTFSLQYLQLDHPKFRISDCPRDFFEAFFRDIDYFQKFTVDAFTWSTPLEHRHPIPFKETTEPNGFPSIDPADDELWTDDAWQFGLRETSGTPSKTWRVHGFLAAEVFYVVWLDPLHKLHS
ncbi:MAG TPA: hypothetical protein VGB94_12930 [Acidobacteriaceae bacterium]